MPPRRSFPTRRSRVARGLAALAAAALLLGAGCGGDEDEATALLETGEPVAGEESAADAPANRAEARAVLAAAREDVARQSTAVDVAREQVESLRAELESAESRLQLARGALDSEQRRLAEAEEQMRRFAVPDRVLFRSVQSELLEAAALRDVAIAAEVSQGVVTLRGRVPDEAAREAAVEIAMSVDGVISVDDRIEVAAAE